jgi:hypothetical protein
MFCCYGGSLDPARHAVKASGAALGLQMSKTCPSFSLSTLATIFVIMGSGVVRADHTCDVLGDEGWSTVATHETVNISDGPPYQLAAGGDWFVDRIVTVLPLCNYINATGNYSLRSYSLSPEDRKDRVAICRAAAEGARVAVPPYAGPCPPK